VAGVTETPIQSASDPGGAAVRGSELDGVLAGLAHEVRNPLQFIKNFAESITELCEEMAAVLEDADLRADVAGDLKGLEHEFGVASSRIVEHTRRVEQILTAMDAAAADAGEGRQWTDLGELAGRAVQKAAEQASGLKVEPPITVEAVDGLPPAFVDANALVSAVANVIVNALEAASDPGARVTPQVWVRTRSTRRGFEIAVTDTGPGLAPGLETRAFEPFFTKWSGHGHAGLGLTHAREIVRRNGGDVQFARDDAGHTVCIVILPN
jgi:signal transduction histidine kinase